MQEPQFTQSRDAFSMTCRVTVTVRASAGRIWGLLTDAQGFSRWNSTVTAIDGDIREGQQLRLHVPGTSRAFAPRVMDVVPDSRMSWVGGFTPIFKGVRTFELAPNADGSTEFAMQERFSGLMMPFIKSSLPDFSPIFVRFASDLKREAERVGA